MLLLSLTLVGLSAAAPTPTPTPWAAFQATWGPDWHRLRVGNDATVAALAAPGVPAANVPRLVSDLARLAQVLPDELVLDRVTARSETGREIIRYERRWHGAEVIGDQLAFVVTHGRVGTVWTRLSPLPALPEPRAGEYVLPLARGAVLVTRVEKEDAVEWRDRTGAVMRRDPSRFDATLTVTAEARGPGDAFVTSAARDVRITTDAGVEVTDDEGSVTLDPPWNVSLDGDLLTIYNDGAPVVIPDVADGDLLAGVDLSPSAANVLVQYHAVRDWLVGRRPDATWLDTPTSAEVDADIACRAYYVSSTDSFAFSDASTDEAPTCVSLGRMADAVRHEVGHRIHVKSLAAGVIDVAISEGSADFLAATMSGDPVVAAGLWGDDYTGVRPNYSQELETDHRYPEDYVGESHEDGRIWGSALWNLRERWEAAEGDAGIFAVDQLYLGALEQGPELTTGWIALLAADDDDGDATNGTPHGCELMELLDTHGIGPGVGGSFGYTEPTLADQPSSATGYPITLTVDALLPWCSDRAAPAAVRVWWTTGGLARLPAAGESDADWELVELLPDGATWTGEIPRVPAGSQVHYYVEVETESGEVAASHADNPDAVASFLVGDQRAVWCDDLEGDLSGWSAQPGSVWNDDEPLVSQSWEAGTPAEADIGGPVTAASGDTIWATSLDGNYRNDSAGYLLTPAVDLSTPGVMRTLRYQRWLGVDDGLFDQAGVWVSEPDGGWSPLWTNPASVYGDLPTVDDAWRPVVLPLGGALAESLRVAFTIEADGDERYTGWNIDDVCVYELDDPDEQYQVQDLALSAASGATTLRWTVPWVTPATDVAVVRSVEGTPTDAADGSVVAHLLPAAPGEPMTWTDTNPPDTNAHYAVFLASAPGTYWGAGEDGANAASAEGGGACGCDTPAGSGLAPWSFALVALVARRRAQVRS